MAATEDQLALIERVRALLADEPSVREISMFGGRSFMASDKMIASALRDGDLLVRVDAEQDRELLDEPGAARAEMGAGRSMGSGWIAVSAGAIASQDRLSFWIEVALECNRRTTTAMRETRATT